MIFDEEVDLALCINLEHRFDRLQRCSDLFERVGLDVQFIRGHGPDDLGFESGHFRFVSRFACLASHLKALRYAEEHCEKAVLILEDDIDINPYFREVLSMVDLMPDTRALFLGGKNRQDPIRVKGPLYKLKWTTDNHAYIVWKPYIKLVARAMADPAFLEDMRFRNSGYCPNKDVLLTRLQRHGGIYGILPSLIWQIENYSTNTGRCWSNYETNGQQKRDL